MRTLDSGASPLHFFGSEVRRARSAAGLTLADLGAMVPCDASTVSRIESGLLSPTERFATACDEAFPQMSGWFSRFYQDSRKWDGPYPRWFLDWVVAEREALTLRMWQVELVPGLLQTGEYARALFRAWQPGVHDGELDDLVNGRLERQGILDKAGAPELWVVLDESVLHRLIGSAKIMRGQLEHLLDTYERPGVTIQVVPTGVGACRVARGVRYCQRRRPARYLVCGYGCPGADCYRDSARRESRIGVRPATRRSATARSVP